MGNHFPHGDGTHRQRKEVSGGKYPDIPFVHEVDHIEISLFPEVIRFQKIPFQCPIAIDHADLEQAFMDQELSYVLCLFDFPKKVISLFLMFFLIHLKMLLWKGAYTIGWKKKTGKTEFGTHREENGTIPLRLR